MRIFTLIPIAMAATGCVTVAQDFSETLPVVDEVTVLGTLDRGDFSYNGSSETDFLIDGRSWGRGSTKDNAKEHREGNTWLFESIEGVLEATGSSQSSRAGVDMDIAGPAMMDTDIITENGRVNLYDVDGIHAVTADYIDGRGLTGDVDFFGDFSVDVDVWPYDFGIIRVESRNSDVYLSLPFGLSYDLQIWGDPEEVMVVDDLGFHTSYLGEGYFAAQSGDAGIRVDVYAYNGSVTVASFY